ncbi:MAG: 2-hydroxyacid dehydrogenase, partial [Capnocytophaga endodontalis]
LHIDKNHPLMLSQLPAQGFENEEDYTNTKEAIESKIADYDGIIIRSRFPIDKTFLGKATRLKFIGRVGAGLENIDCNYAESKGITLIAAPEGNRNAVGEHALGMLLALLNKLKKANNEIKNGKWLREENRGWELDGKTVGIIGYGNMGKSFAKKLRGFDCNVICYDILPDKGDENAKQVTLVDFFRQADIVSLHTPQTPQTEKMINTAFINSFAKSFWFLNTARGKSVVTDDLVNALKNGKVLGAGLDVLEYEKASFEDFFSDGQMPESFKYLLDADNVILTPHIAGWTLESKEKLAQIIVDKIISQFRN